jgi:endonuclease/exonuclease/phosphatase family metal-dependent hydrolase
MEESVTATSVRVLSYNIRSMRDDTAALVRVIRGCRPDVVCVQEAPRFAFWRCKRRSLARRSGLTVVAGRRNAGLALLAGPGVRVVHSEYHLLSCRPFLHRRALALAVLEAGGKRFAAASTHLDLAAEPRRDHVEEVHDLLDRLRRRFPVPVVLGGDINEPPGGPAWTLLADRMPDAYATAPTGHEHTFSAGSPRIRIDGIFTDPGVEVLGCGVPADAGLVADYAAATDHRPVLAELRLP